MDEHERVDARSNTFYLLSIFGHWSFYLNLFHSHRWTGIAWYFTVDNLCCKPKFRLSYSSKNSSGFNKILHNGWCHIGLHSSSCFSSLIHAVILFGLALASFSFIEGVTFNNLLIKKQQHQGESLTSVTHHESLRFDSCYCCPQTVYGSDYVFTVYWLASNS